jgi:hypothetical protein
MTIRITASRLLLAAALGAGMLTGPMVTAPPAAAACTAGQIADPITGICWSQSATNLGITGTGGTCLPGRLGLCLAALQNSAIPRANMPTNVGPGANRTQTWP